MAKGTKDFTGNIKSALNESAPEYDLLGEKNSTPDAEPKKAAAKAATAKKVKFPKKELQTKRLVAMVTPSLEAEVKKEADKAGAKVGVYVRFLIEEGLKAVQGR